MKRFLLKCKACQNYPPSTILIWTLKKECNTFLREYGVKPAVSFTDRPLLYELNKNIDIEEIEDAIKKS